MPHPRRPRALLVPALLGLALTAAAGLATPARAGRAEVRIAAAAETFAIAQARYAAGTITVDDVYTWSVRWLDAQRDQPLKGKALVAAAAAHLDRMTALEAEVTAAVAAGRASSYDLAAARYYRAEAELWVERKGKR